MSLPGLTAFRPPPTAASSQGTPDTITVAVRLHGLSATQIVAGSTTGSSGANGPSQAPAAGAAITATTSAAVPASASGPVFVCPGNPLGIVRVYNPTGGQPVYIGVDSTINPVTAYLLNPGYSLMLESYTGSVWALSASLAATLYYLNEATV